MVALEISILRPGERTDTVPVVWMSPPAWASELDVAEAVLVVGRARRRFYKAGAATRSRTEVVAESVVPLRHAQRCRRALAAGVGGLGDALEVFVGAAVPRAGTRRRQAVAGSPKR